MASIDYKALYEAKCVENEALKAENIAMWDAISSHKCEESDIGDFELKKDKDGIPLHPFTAIRNELNAEIEKLKEEVKKLQEERFRMCERANASGVDIYDSEEESDEESEEESDEE